MEISRVGEFSLGWGESLVWDDERRRLYFVDCAAQTLHWLEDGHEELHTLRPGSMPTGVVPTDDGRVVVVLQDGLHLVDPDSGANQLLSPYPDGLGDRANDACADLDGNLITGTLNLGPADGSTWWYSAREGWRLLDDAISNTNGPTVGVLDGVPTLIVGDTSADYFAYDYDATSGTVGARRVFGDTSGLDGAPDGATLDAQGGLWCALVGGAQLARFTAGGLDRTLPVPAADPTDVTFGGPDLDRLYVVSVGSTDPGDTGLDGALLVIDGLDHCGRPEPRFRTTG
jgi:sugar lactone lactonase YvrE